MTSAPQANRVDPRIAAAVDVLLTGRLTLLQRRALAELLVAAADAPGAQLATVHGSAVDALAPRPARPRGESRATRTGWPGYGEP